MRERLALAPAAAALAAAVLLPDGRLEVPWLLFGAVFVLDATGRVFLAFTGLLYAAAALQAPAYLAGDPRRGRHGLFLAAAAAGNVGLVLAGDLFAFLAAFALMSFSTYGVVVHADTAEARRAGRIYLVLVIVGEVLLFTGLALAIGGGGDPGREAVARGVLEGGRGAAAGTLLFAGFGIKAGALPLQGWLPLAHPVAPAPASAVMSGAMIKAGLLGWLRFLPLGDAAFPVAGTAVLALGLAAAFYAAFVGACQTRPKAVLAYSSIGQMGLITAGVGAGLARPDAWPALAGATVLYAAHHALAKGALFLGMGVLAQGGGRALRALLVLPALALAGAPFTSGALAKSGLKAALGAAPTLVLLLSLAAVGTTVLMARFLVVARPPARQAPAGLWAPFLVVLGASLAAPWLLAPEATVAKALSLATTANLAWPVALGAALAALAGWVGHRRGLRLPAVPPGDYLVAILDGLGYRGARRQAPAPGHTDAPGGSLPGRRRGGTARSRGRRDQATATWPKPRRSPRWPPRGRPCRWPSGASPRPPSGSRPR